MGRESPFDLDPAQFRALGHRLVDDLGGLLEALASPSTLPVTPAESSAEVRAALGGGPLADYRLWARANEPTAVCPGGGESRVGAAARFARGYRLLLGRPEATIFAVAHGLPVRYLLSALLEEDPAAVVDPVQHAEPNRVSRRQLERGVARLERWCDRPAWAA